MPEPVTKCGACAQSDDHPKHQVALGVGTTSEGRKLYDEHDFDHNGTVSYHFDCPSEWHDLAALLAPEPFASPDPAQPWLEWEESSAAEHRAVAEIHASIVAQAKSGVHGDELRQWIANLNQRGGAGGIDQTRANHALDGYGPNSATTTMGVDTITGPCHLRLMTANGSDSSAGTELGTSGGYTAGGSAIAFAVASAGSKATNAPVSWTNMPSSTLTGIEEWDTSGTALRLFWAPWSGGSIVVASGNTLTVSSAALSNAIA